ncbi:hypothetical protein [Homoserinimonas hongtaonis]|uniref:hypothetical protein n=1 Tax=Homoserinimonas hongtaonis TaxID=2079791 RepID=UPI00131F3BDC|nr:hypothetical protein [Salinibacterium hongtaonis]
MTTTTTTTLRGRKALFAALFIALATALSVAAPMQATAFGVQQSPNGVYGGSSFFTNGYQASGLTMSFDGASSQRCVQIAHSSSYTPVTGSLRCATSGTVSYIHPTSVAQFVGGLHTGTIGSQSWRS